MKKVNHKTTQHQLPQHKIKFVSIPNNVLVNVQLTPDEIEEIIRCVEDVPHGVFVFMNYNRIIKKLKDAEGRK